jgi:hypothetical protein
LSRRALEIFLQFNRRTGHEHPHLRTVIGNYTSLLDAVGQTPEQIHARLDEIGRSIGISLADFL